MAQRRETELYGPIKAFLQEQGYEVKGEVNGCDLVALRGDDLVIVELKAAFNLALVLQGVDRQRLAEAVYLAVEAPRSRRAVPRWSECQQLCRRLGLGLLLVHFTGRAPTVEPLIDPAPYQPRRALKQQGRLLKEFARRTGDHNAGGSTRRPIVTAYREEALKVAAAMAAPGSGGEGVAPKQLKAATGIAGTASILRVNHYGWFERIAPGRYRLSDAGQAALEQYADVVGQPAPS